MKKDNNYEMVGTVTEVLPTQKIGAKGFQKREFRIKQKSEGSWPNFVPFVLTKDNCDIGDKLQEGAEVNVHFKINGRIWDKGDGSPTRCFCDNECWKVDILSKGKPSMPPPAEPDEFAGIEEEIPF
jgi:hypothetical protein